MRSGMTRLSIDVDRDLYKLIKHTATFEDKTIRDFVVEAVRERLRERLTTQRSEFNELTRMTLGKTDRGEDLHEYANIDDFFAEMAAEAEE